jgi:hypothetical protein
LIGSPSTAAIARRNRGPCTLVGLFRNGGPGGAVSGVKRASREFLYRDDGPGGAVGDIEGERPGLEPTGSSDRGRGGSRGSRRGRLVTSEVQALAALLDPGGANRARRLMGKVGDNHRGSGVVWEETASPREHLAS